MPYEPFDVTGRRIKVGDVVRVIGVPSFEGMSEEVLEECRTREVFEYLVGRYKRVSEFDQYGCAELFFTIPKGRERGMHSVAIEPWLLRVKRSRQRA